MPRAFSQTHLVLDRDPEDADLVQLLGDDEHPGSFDTVDEDGVLAMQPQRIPIKRITVFVILFACALTALAVFAEDWGLSFEGPIAWAMVTLTWVAVAPVFIGILWAIDRRFARMGPYFRIDRGAGTIWLRQSDRSLAIADVVELVRLERWHRYGGKWGRTRQWTVVAFVDGRHEVHPVIREIDPLLMGDPIDKVLTEALGRRSRRIKLSTAESKALGDG
jgi:hypothetical protein